MLVMLGHAGAYFLLQDGKTVSCAWCATGDVPPAASNTGSSGCKGNRIFTTGLCLTSAPLALILPKSDVIGSKGASRRT